MICADQQIHSGEAKALNNLANQAKINQLTLQSMDKILAQDRNCLSIEDIAQNVPMGQRSETLRQVLAIAYVDGFFAPLEREVVNQITQLWGIPESEVDQILESAQGFGLSPVDQDDDQANLSIGARLLKGAESLLSRSLISKLTELAPENVGKRIEQLQREILLSGSGYDEAIQHCAKIAGEDYRYAKKALEKTALHNRGMNRGDIKWNVQSVNQPISVKMVIRKANRITSV